MPYHLFGGSGPPVHFAHSNGFPPACFQQMIRPLLPEYRVLGMYQRPLWPGMLPEDLVDWQMMADDMIRFFEQVGIAKVIGIGHSLGAVTSMFAALKRPDLFRCLVFIEPVFLPPALTQLLAANPTYIQQAPVIAKAKKRRDRWPTRQEAFERFRANPVFQYWSDASLWDYVNHATHQDGANDVVLTYSRAWEERVYSLVPLDIWQRLPELSHPVLAIRGAESDALHLDAWEKWQEIQPGTVFVQIEQAGHMVLMERPRQVADAILKFLHRQGFG
jgi:pimeloyl-ACP methyl ester carboxylesterase